MAIKVFGGVYLLWLAFKSGKSALTLTMTRSVVHQAERSQSLAHLYGRGALLHLKNLKAILVWISIAGLAPSTGTGKDHAIAVVPGCVVIGMLVFGGYAVVFSTATARWLYARTRRAMEGCLAIMFGVAAIRFLTARV